MDGMEPIALNTSQSNFQNWGCVISGVTCCGIALDSVTTSSRANSKDTDRVVLEIRLAVSHVGGSVDWRMVMISPSVIIPRS